MTWCIQIMWENNYVIETLMKNQFLYGTEMEDWGLENIRLDIVFVMIDGGDAISLDELNEILNLWNKSCVGTPYFAKACERSKLIMLLRKCACTT